MTSAICLALIAILLPPTVALVRSALLGLWKPLSTFVELPSEDLQRWTKERTVGAITGGPPMWLCGLINLSLALVSLAMLGIPFHDPAAKTVAVTALMPLFFFCGTSAFSFAVLLSLPYRVSKLPTRVTAYHDRYYGATSLNPFIFRVSLIALGYYLLLMAAVSLGPYPLASPMAVWLSAIGCAVLLVFPVSVWGLHRSLADAKSEVLRSLAQVLEQRLEATLAQPSPENIALISSLFEVRNNLGGLPTWPVDFRTVLTLLTTVLLPILAILVELLRK